MNGRHRFMAASRLARLAPMCRTRSVARSECRRHHMIAAAAFA
jgi:hypothetical protein